MSIIKSRIKALIGPQLSRKVSGLLYGDYMDEVALVYRTFSQLRVVGTMLDVGAHQGGSMHSFAAAKWKVHAFEPDPNNRRHLATLAAKYPNVTIDPRGVSDKSRSAIPFFVSDEIGSISSLSRFHDTHKTIRTIDLVSLSEFAKEIGLHHIEFLKIDVEGHDLFVLHGVDWARLSPDCIICEFEDRKTTPNGYSTQELFNYLSSRGYEIVISEWYPISEYGAKHRWKAFRRLPSEIDSQGWGNIIAYRAGTRIAPLLDFETLSREFCHGEQL